MELKEAPRNKTKRCSHEEFSEDTLAKKICRWRLEAEMDGIATFKEFSKTIFQNLVGCNDLRLRLWWAWRLWNHFHHGLPKSGGPSSDKNACVCCWKKHKFPFVFLLGACSLFWGVMETLWGLRYPQKTPGEWGELYLSGQIYNDQTAEVTLNGGLGTESPQYLLQFLWLLGQLATSEAWTL